MGMSFFFFLQIDFRDYDVLAWIGNKNVSKPLTTLHLSFQFSSIHYLRKKNLYHNHDNNNSYALFFYIVPQWSGQAWAAESLWC